MMDLEASIDPASVPGPVNLQFVPAIPTPVTPLASGEAGPMSMVDLETVDPELDACLAQTWDYGSSFIASS